MCASLSARVKPTSASMPMVCAITSGTRRACAGAAPSMHGADRRIQSQIANVASRLISELGAIHMRPPTDQHRTNPGPPPNTDATDLHEAWDCRLTNAVPVLMHSSAFMGPTGETHGSLAGHAPDTRRTLPVDNFQAPGSAASLRRASQCNPGRARLGGCTTLE